MPTPKKNNNQKKNTLKKRTTSRPKMPSQASRKSSGEISYMKVAQMLNDPCSGDQRPGSYGNSEGTIVPVRSVVDVPSWWAGNNNAFFVWFPDYEAAGSSTGTALLHTNAFLYATTNPDVPPVYSGYGTGSSTNQSTSISIPDPAYNIMTGGVYSTCRTISACIKVTYLGDTSSEQGQLYPLTGLSPHIVRTGGAGSSNASPTVNEYASYSAHGGFRTSNLEVKHRPILESFEFDQPNGPFATNTSSSITIYDSTKEAVGIGFVLSNVSNVGDYKIELFKNIEAKPEPSSMLRAVVPRGMANPNLLSRALHYLDTHFPNWQATAKEVGMALISRALQSMVLGGRLPR